MVNWRNVSIFAVSHALGLLALIRGLDLRNDFLMILGIAVLVSPVDFWREYFPVRM